LLEDRGNVISVSKEVSNKQNVQQTLGLQTLSESMLKLSFVSLLSWPAALTAIHCLRKT